jgi:hypothetical protein
MKICPLNLFISIKIEAIYDIFFDIKRLLILIFFTEFQDLSLLQMIFLYFIFFLPLRQELKITILLM